MLSVTIGTIILTAFVQRHTLLDDWMANLQTPVKHLNRFSAKINMLITRRHLDETSMDFKLETSVLL